MGMDVDGPQNDKGLYALLPVRPQMSIEPESVSPGVRFAESLAARSSRLHVAGLSARRYVATTINDLAKGGLRPAETPATSP